MGGQMNYRMSSTLPGDTLTAARQESPVRVRVDESKCQGHTLCAMSAPQVFLLREPDGHAYVTDEVVAPDEEGRVRDAVATCPEQAIIISD